MRDPLHKGTSPVCHRDLGPTKRIGFAANSSVVGHPYAVMSHIRVCAGDRGAAHREYRQHGYYDSDNHSLDTHYGLPDIGPKCERDQFASAPANLFRFAIWHISGVIYSYGQTVARGI
jgi:hypothetical protein